MPSGVPSRVTQSCAKPWAISQASGTPLRLQSSSPISTTTSTLALEVLPFVSVTVKRTVVVPTG